MEALTVVVAWIAAHPMEAAYIATILVNLLPEKVLAYLGPIAGLTKALGGCLYDAAKAIKPKQLPPPEAK